MGRYRINHLFVTTIFILISATSICRSDDADCVYTAYIRTSSIWKGGTDSIISLTLYDASGYGIRINDIEAWGGLMGPDYDYFERKNLDIFSGLGPCLTGPPCEMNLTSDGSGSGHGWYCNYVEVTTTGVHMPCAQQEFEVEQWLATDTSPYELTAIRNYCDQDASTRRRVTRHVILESKLNSSTSVAK
ncbi:PLAT domain-containing protein 3-like [Bidens hawaiensis]|uniref:PLAT domain-containing protein 3-like n=1 Tax=Bidens hawaiensis TaxID=980011 RepID=UPI0040497507